MSIALVCGDGGLLFKLNTKTAPFVVGVKANNLDVLPISLYPNPINDKLFLEFKDNKDDIQVIVSDVLGVTINETTFTNSKAEIEFSPLPRGIYFVSIKSQKGQRRVKVFKE